MHSFWLVNCGWNKIACYNNFRSRNNRRCPNNNSNTTTTSRHGVFTDSNSSLKQTTLSMYSKKHTKRKQPTPTTTKVCLGNDGFNRNNINNLNETITTTASSSLLNNNFKNNATGDTMDSNVGVKLMTDVDFSVRIFLINCFDFTSRWFFFCLN